MQKMKCNGNFGRYPQANTIEKGKPPVLNSNSDFDSSNSTGAILEGNLLELEVNSF
jgi:hypothetical protein